MTEIVLPDKISESILNIIKRGNVFEKIKKIENLVFGCAILVTVFGTSIVITGFYNTRIIIDNYFEQKNYQMLINKQTNSIQKLQYKVDNLLEFNKKLMTLLFPKKEPNRRPVYELNDDDTLLIQSTVSSITLDLDSVDNSDDSSNQEENENVENVENYGSESYELIHNDGKG
jgi:hypothetical protein